MRLIIAGGRDYNLTQYDFDFIGSLPRPSVVVTGGCRGVDQQAEVWAKSLGIRTVTFAANWEKYGKKAGPLRNESMAHYAHAVVLFPGGRGTESMYQEAKKEGLKIYDRRIK